MQVTDLAVTRPEGTAQRYGYWGAGVPGHPLRIQAVC